MDEFLKRLEKLLINYDCDSRELKSELDDLILGSAKRVRPRLARLLVLANGETLSETQENFIAAGELLHTASLIHDDVIDDADKRRGKISFHKRYDSKLAVIAGDLLAASAMNKIIKIGNLEIIKLFQTTFEKMCNAEVCQYYERGKVPSLEIYLEKTKNKTALLFAEILEGVALLSRSIEKKKARELGLAFGMVFQIRNDLHSFNSESSNDKKNEVYTAPDIFMSQGCEKSLAIEKTELLIDNEKKFALSILGAFPDSVYKDELRLMIEDL